MLPAYNFQNTDLEMLSLGFAGFYDAGSDFFNVVHPNKVNRINANAFFPEIRIQEYLDNLQPDELFFGYTVEFLGTGQVNLSFLKHKP